MKCNTNGRYKHKPTAAERREFGETVIERFLQRYFERFYRYITGGEDMKANKLIDTGSRQWKDLMARDYSDCEAKN